MDRKDFDQFSRDFKRQVEAFPTRLVLRIVLGVFALTVLLAAGFSSFYTVEADEVGVVQRFGRYTGTPSEPGLHFKLPFGIDRYTPVKVDRVVTLEFGFRTEDVPRRGRTVYTSGPETERLMLTGDQNVVSVEWIVQYKIKDPAAYLFNVKDSPGTISDVSASVMRLVVGDSSATEVITTRRADVAAEVKRRLQECLDGYQSGIDIQNVELQNVVPPTKRVQDSFNEVNTAQQEKEKTIYQAKKEYRKAIPEAEGQARKVIQEAEGFRLKRVNEAKGDVAKFEKLLGEYQNSKEVTRQRLYLEAMQEALPKLSQIYVIDEKQGRPLQVLNLKDALSGSARPQIPEAQERQRTDARGSGRRR